MINLSLDKHFISLKQIQDDYGYDHNKNIIYLIKTRI